MTTPLSSSGQPWQPLPNIDKHCFGCGPDNVHGLHMTFARRGDQVRAALTIPGQFRGWSNLVHGGVIATILDEIMSWTAIVVARRFILTRSMTVRYHRPIHVGATVSAIGVITEWRGERRATVRGEIFDDRERLCASAEGDFALFTKEQFGSLGIIPEEDLRLMAEGL